MTFRPSSARWHHLFWCGLAALFGAGLRSLEAQPVQKPKPLELAWGDIYLRTEMQYENESQSAGSPPARFTRTDTIIEPAVGFGLLGSVYNPNLLQFRLNTELGPSWEESKTDAGGFSSVRLLQRYDGSVDIFAEKPYATSLYGDKDMTYRNYDFFSRVRVDSEQYGARSGYAQGPVPVSVGVQHYAETEDNTVRPRDFRQDTLSLTAQNRRQRFDGATRLSYSLADFTRRDDGFNTTHGLLQNLNLTDNEQFGVQKQAQLTSLLNYSSLAQTLLPTDQLLAQEDLRLQHTRKLDSFYSYSFNASSAGNSSADTHDARAGLNYQWLRNLSSGLDVLGDLTDSSSPGSSLATRTYGAGLNAQYSPALSSWAQVMVSDDAHWQHDDRDASGQSQNVIGEAHALTDGAVVLLNQPGVLAGSIRVWGDSAHTILYVEGIDYLVMSHGSFTQIERIPGGTIPNGANVFVDYSATLQGSAGYDSLANNASFRLDLWNRLLGFYARWSVQTFDGGENLLLRTLNDKTVGVDSSWRWFHAGAEYETVDSNLAPYDRTRFFQSVSFQPCAKTVVGLDADEGWTDFNDSHLRQTSYGVIGRLQQRVTSHLTGGAEAGVRIDRGQTFDRTLATCRFYLDWNIGKLMVKASYEFNDEYHVTDRQDRHYVFIRIRRDFK
ncbi:MAG TPA: hypothetical protein VF988_08690 [Verrucomicrobiae bacterium]